MHAFKHKISGVYPKKRAQRRSSIETLPLRTKNPVPNPISLFVKRMLRRPVLEPVGVACMHLLPRAIREWVARKIVPQLALYPRDSWREVTRQGIHYRLDISQKIEHALFWGFNDRSKERFYRFVEPGWVCADVGTNIGEVSMNLASLAGTAGHVFSFEPDPRTYAKLQHNLSLNPHLKVTAMNVGVGEKNETLNLYQFQEGNDGANRILRNQTDSSGLPERGKVHIIRLDDVLLHEHHIGKLNLIKIDVEGFEHEVLKGAMALLTKFKPRLVIEVIDRNLKINGSSAVQLFAWIEALGYKIERLDDGKPLSAESPLDNCVMDIYCYV